jgi:hypothetical protein
MSKTKPIKKHARSNQSLLLSDFLLGLLFDPADGDTFPETSGTYIELHGITSQKIVVFNT